MIFGALVDVSVLQNSNIPNLPLPQPLRFDIMFVFVAVFSLYIRGEI